jgi:hypothetical protein
MDNAILDLTAKELGAILDLGSQQESNWLMTLLVRLEVAIPNGFRHSSMRGASPIKYRVPMKFTLDLRTITPRRKQVKRRNTTKKKVYR